MAAAGDADLLALANRRSAAGDFTGAAVLYRAVAERFPGHGEARIKLAHVLKLAGAYTDAAAVLQELEDDYPDDPAVQTEFGRLAFAQHRPEEARDRFCTVLRRHPDDADAHHWLAAIAHLSGDEATAQAHFRRTVAVKPLLRVAAAKTPPDFSAIFLFAPGDANTPPDALVKQARYDCGFLMLMQDARYDVAALRRNAHVVVNLVSDADQGAAILPVADALVEGLGLPAVNHPGAIRRTGREGVAALLAGIPGCHIPRVRRFTAGQDDIMPDGEPLLLRVAGTHGGTDFEKVGDPVAARDFTARHNGANCYATEYIDTRSEDGFFRKYRFFFVGERIFPYHLAIGHRWKVHHGTTGMANQAWMQQEEAAFLDDPTRVFGPAHYTALHAIRQAIGLEFFGVDCAIGRDGRLVVFEANATMLVHTDYRDFPYKASAVERIRAAFNAMLQRMASADRMDGADAGN